MTAISRETTKFLAAWSRIGIHRADIALRRISGSWWQSCDHPIDALPLPLARAANLHHADIYIRPTRGPAAPFVFLDDLPTVTACRLIAVTAGIAVHTSIPGGCQVWLALSTSIHEQSRTILQRALARQFQADPASISGEHYGRLPGFRNWKRDGYWVTIRASNFHALRLDPENMPPSNKDRTALTTPTAETQRSPNDTSPSAHEWGWVCGALEHGGHPEMVRQQLIRHARPRRGSDAERYANLTIRKALARKR